MWEKKKKSMRYLETESKILGDKLDVKDKGVGQEWLYFWLEQQVDGSDINSDGESQVKRS